MAKWLKTILNDGMTSEGKQVIRKEFIDRTFKPEISFDDLIVSALGNRLELARGTSYSLGYFNGYARGVGFDEHGGDLPRFHSIHTLIRSVKFGFFFSTN